MAETHHEVVKKPFCCLLNLFLQLSRPFLSMRVISRLPQKDSVMNITVLQQDGGIDKAQAAETVDEWTR